MAAALGERAGDVEGAVAIEGGDLDRDDALDVEEAAPEAAIEDPSAHRRLKIEPDHRDDLGDPPAVVEEGGVVGVAQRREAEKGGVVADGRRELRFAERLIGRADHSGDRDRRRLPGATPAVHRPKRELEHRLQQADFRFPDLELRGVDRHRDPAGAGVAVVARERDLPAFVEPAVGGQRERVRRDHQAAEERPAQLDQPAGVRNGHR